MMDVGLPVCIHRFKNPQPHATNLYNIPVTYDADIYGTLPYALGSISNFVVAEVRCSHLAPSNRST